MIRATPPSRTGRRLKTCACSSTNDQCFGVVTVWMKTRKAEVGTNRSSRLSETTFEERWVIAWGLRRSCVGAFTVWMETREAKVEEISSSGLSEKRLKKRTSQRNRMTGSSWNDWEEMGLILSWFEYGQLFVLLLLACFSSGSFDVVAYGSSLDIQSSQPPLQNDTLDQAISAETEAMEDAASTWRWSSLSIHKRLILFSLPEQLTRHFLQFRSHSHHDSSSLGIQPSRPPFERSTLEYESGAWLPWAMHFFQRSKANERRSFDFHYQVALVVITIWPFEPISWARLKSKPSSNARTCTPRHE